MTELNSGDLWPEHLHQYQIAKSKMFASIPILLSESAHVLIRFLGSFLVNICPLLMASSYLDYIA